MANSTKPSTNTSENHSAMNSSDAGITCQSMPSSNKTCADVASPLIVTLDGPAGVGKSTLAKQVAQTLAIGYLDTGAMFRTIALKTLQRPISATDDSANTASGIEVSGSKTNGNKAGLSGTTSTDDGATLLNAIGSLHFSLRNTLEGSELLCNGEPITEAIRSEEVAAQAAKIATFPAIRDFLKSAQQAIGASTSLVAEGRDMGTVVFPQARYKFFLEASVEVRAKRRYDQLILMGHTADMEEISQQIRQRDEQDRNRTVAPLIPAEEAILIDTSALSIEGVLAAILTHCRN